MTGEEFRAAGVLLFGEDRCTVGMADLLGMSARNVRRFSNGSKPIGHDFAEELIRRVAFAIGTQDDYSPGLRIVRDALAYRNQPAGD